MGPLRRSLERMSARERKAFMSGWRILLEETEAETA